MPAKGRRSDLLPKSPGRHESNWFLRLLPFTEAAMTLDEYNVFCGRLAHTSHVVQWGNAHVWKIATKVFAIGGWQKQDKELFVTFKVSPMSFDLLKEEPGCRPAPYLASRGMKWLQRTDASSMDDDGLKDYLRESYRLVSLGLSKKRQMELGLNQD
jgi:predicted DNA-binding protein (MmcQ/YjbR family)